MAINPALIGKSGELLVAGELMRRGIEVAYPASDVGVDLLAFRLGKKETVPDRIVPIQVKARSKTGFNFQRSWFDRVPGVVLVHVWHLETSPEFYLFDSLTMVEDALGPVYSKSPSWLEQGKYSVSDAQPAHSAKMQPHRDKWERIVSKISS